jgi:hypothetical protein
MTSISLPPSSSSTNVSSSTLLSLYKLGFKLVPLDDIHEFDVEWSYVSDNPDYWHPDSFNDPTVCSKFTNVASALGKTHIKDSLDNANLFIQVLDTDLEYVYNIVTTPLSQLITQSDVIKNNIYSLFKSVDKINYESKYSNVTLLEFCKKHTFVTKTKKANGYHIWWLSRTPNKSILTYECKRGFEIEIKADERGGLCILPPSTHRDYEDFRYYAVGRTDSLLISDILYNLLIELFSGCLRNKIGNYENAVDNKRRLELSAKTQKEMFE